MPELRPYGPLAEWHKAIFQVFDELEPDEAISLIEVNRRRQAVQGIFPGDSRYWGGQAGSVNFFVSTMVKRGYIEMTVVSGRKLLRRAEDTEWNRRLKTAPTSSKTAFLRHMHRADND